MNSMIDLGRERREMERARERTGGEDRAADK